MAEPTVGHMVADDLVLCHGRVTECLNGIRAAVRDGVEPESEAVHRVRTNTRRARSALRVGRPLWGKGQCRALGRTLGDLARVFAPARELDVLVAFVEGETEASRLDPGGLDALLQVAAADRSIALHEATEALANNDELTKALDDLRDLAQQEPKHTKRAARPAREAFEAAFSKVERRAKRSKPADFATAAEAELHGYRLRLKGLRDTMRAFGPILTKAEKRRLALIKAQLDQLGHIQDAVAGQTRIATWIETGRIDGQAGEAVVMALRQHAKRARDALTPRQV